MTRDERLRKIMELLQEKGTVRVAELSERFDVADMTVRRDLDGLARQGKLTRIHGGALARKSPAYGGAVADEPAVYGGGIRRETSYTVRMEQHLSEKSEIAAAAAEQITSGETVFLDSGSTTFLAAGRVPLESGCTYITNGVNVAMALLERGCRRVILIGGEVELNTWSSRGSLATQQLCRMHFDLAFLSCNAVSPRGEVMIGNDAETGIKQSVMQAARRILLAADSSKFDRYSLVSYACVGDFEGILSDSGLSPESAAHVRESGGTLLWPQVSQASD